MFLSIAIYAQNGSLSGTITSANGVPVPQVSVYMKGLSKGTFTNEEGVFSIKNVKPGTHDITVSFIGYETHHTQVTISANVSTKLDVQLKATEEELQEVIVSAIRNNPNERTVASVSLLPVKVKYQSQALTILDNKLLTEQQLMNLDEAINYAPGFNLESTRGNQYPNIQVRGAKATILVNGLRLQSSTREGDGNFDFNTLDNIQFISGSSSIGLGNGSIGGAVNTVTKQATFKNDGYVFSSLGSFGRTYNGFDKQFSMADDKLGFRVNGSWSKGETFRDDVDFEAFTIAPSVAYKISEKDMVKVDYIYNNDERSQDVGQLRVDSLLLAKNGIFIEESFRPSQQQSIREDYLGFKDDFQKQITNTVFANYTHKFSEKISLGVTGGINHKDRTSRGINTRRAYQDTDRDGAADVFARSSVYQETGATSSSVRADFLGKDVKLGVKQNFQLSVDLYKNKNFAKGNGSESRDPGPEIDRIDILNPQFESNISNLSPEAQEAYFAELLNTNNKSENTINGITFQDQLELTQKLRLTLGLRYSWVTSFNELHENLGTDSLRVSESDRIDTGGFSPSVAAFYDLNRNITVYGSYTNTFSETSISPTRVNINGEQIGPEVFDQLEAGIRGSFFQNRFGANLVFYNIYNNNVAVQAVDINNDPLTSPDAVSDVNPDGEYFVEVGEQRRRGAEISLQGKVTDALTLYGTYAYYEFAQKSTESGDAVVQSTDYNPKNSASLIANYEFLDGFLENFKIGAGSVFTGDRTVSTRGGSSISFVNDAFTTFSLTAGYQINKFSINAKFNNLTNELAYNYFGTTFINPIAPFNFDVRLTYNF
ncbi:TonB-dependent receptor [Galbibacter mesophilus]|uniref:TonB-dependent receptor n=1 Tax=Galbibacter mesophilus TaxID=379069 RepID=UPI00191F1814|nr:TonB-dependent receptor [Galbibacter mesophilus]MCM5663011.1 TonB-dependent receptor [Galbibacter mesophilus]